MTHLIETSMGFRICGFLLILLRIACAPSVFGQGGPPLLTDDPGTPGNRNWEINTAYFQVLTRDDRKIQAPLLDINYGLGDRIQLKCQTPFIWENDGDGRYRSA